MAGVSSSTGHNKLMILFQNQSVEPHNLQLKELKEITNDLSDERLLGQGGFGKVYKGVLPNGDMIAVKKLTWTMTGIQDKHYQNEARHLMRLKHLNIVQLVGYCSETEKELVLHNGKYVYAEKPERLICLQYVPKGSHCRHLSDESSGLDWDTRYKIIKGICCGLHYLHEEWQPGTPMIHRDLKPANILLNDNMVPKIADFGLSRIFGEEPTRTITKNLDGTLGYMAPEYLNRGIITKELDIFSLGVIIIEIMTGHKHYPYKDETSSQEFIELVVEKWRNRLKNTPGYTSREIDIRSCIEVALLCVKLDRAERPTIRQIIQKLAFGCDPKSMFGGGAAGRWIREAKIEAAKQETVAAAGKEASNEDEVKKKRKGKKPEGAGEAEPIAAVEKSLSVPPVDLSYNKLPQPSASVSYFGHAPQPLPQPAYSVQQPQPQHWSPSYMYMPSPQTAPETYYQDSWLQPIPRDSYRIFDEENPNACSIM